MNYYLLRFVSYSCWVRARSEADALAQAAGHVLSVREATTEDYQRIYGGI